MLFKMSSQNQSLREEHVEREIISKWIREIYLQHIEIGASW